MTKLTDMIAGAVFTATVAGGAWVAPAQAQEAYLGEVRMFATTFCPRGFADANGQLLPIAQNEALFSLLGTNYGGDGRTTFGLPDLRGRVAMHTGTGPGLTNRPIGAKGGSETTTMNVNNMPSHSHSLNVRSSDGTVPEPVGNLIADAGREDIYGTGAVEGSMDANAIGASGAGQPINNMQPYQVMRYCVVMQGIYPSRN